MRLFRRTKPCECENCVRRRQVEEGRERIASSRATGAIAAWKHGDEERGWKLALSIDEEFAPLVGPVWDCLRTT